MWALYLYWFYNDGFATNLVFRGFCDFPNLETKKHVYGFLILRETWTTLDKNPLKRLEVWKHKKKII